MSLFIPGASHQDETDKNQTKIAVPTFVNPFSNPSPEPTPAQDNLPVPISTSKETAISPSIDNLIDGVETRIKLAHAHDTALNTVVEAIEHMRTKLDDIKPDKLPSVIAAASKVVEGIRKERTEAAKVNDRRAVHLHFYTPTPKQMDEYEVIDVN